jgi:hypothetical protein
LVIFVPRLSNKKKRMLGWFGFDPQMIEVFWRTVYSLTGALGLFVMIVVLMIFLDKQSSRFHKAIVQDHAMREEEEQKKQEAIREKRLQKKYIEMMDQLEVMKRYHENKKDSSEEEEESDSFSREKQE